QVGRVRRGSAFTEKHAKEKPARNRFFERLDLTHADRNGKCIVFADHHVGGSHTIFLRASDDVFCGVFELLHYLLVPPTVISRILMVGRPTPTGIVWPSLPQIPTPWSSFRSLPTAVTCRSTVGPSPIKVAPLTGDVTLPSSIR